MEMVFTLINQAKLAVSHFSVILASSSDQNTKNVTWSENEYNANNTFMPKVNRSLRKTEILINLEVCWQDEKLRVGLCAVTW